MRHYAELLRYSSSAGFLAKEYLSALSSVQNQNIERIRADLKKFCDKHDYRNANMPLGDAETALKNAETEYGEGVCVTACCPEECYDALCVAVRDATGGKAMPERKDVVYA